MKEQVALESVALKVYGNSKYSLGDCLREALAMCVTEWRNVELIYIGKVYHISVNDLVSCAKPLYSEDTNDTIPKTL